MSAISGCSWAPKVARKCEIKHWFPCCANGRSFGVQSREYQSLSDGLIMLAPVLYAYACGALLQIEDPILFVSVDIYQSVLAKVFVLQFNPG